MKVVFFGRLKEAIASELELDLPVGSPIARLREALIGEHPAAEAALSNVRARACVGETVVADDYVPGAADVVEFLPPVSGG